MSYAEPNNRGQRQIRNAVTSAANQRDALIVIADALDAILDVLWRDDAPADPWTDWSQPLIQPQTHDDFMAEPELLPDPQEQERHAQQLAATQQQLATATDPEEIQALSAKLRLLNDTGRPLLSPVEEGNRVRVSSDGTTGEVELPPVSQERKDARYTWAVNMPLWHYIPLDEAQSCDAFIKGGPMWLYLANRDAVMQLPYAARQWLVEEIALDSQAQAQEVGRDILKSADSTDKEITLQAIEAISAARG